MSAEKQLHNRYHMNMEEDENEDYDARTAKTAKNTNVEPFHMSATFNKKGFFVDDVCMYVCVLYL